MGELTAEDLLSLAKQGLASDLDKLGGLPQLATQSNTQERTALNMQVRSFDLMLELMENYS